MPVATSRLKNFLVNLSLALGGTALFFGLAEGALALAGVQPLSLTEDPYFGFASGQPLFEKKTRADGSEWYETRAAKLQHFNPQSFPAKKAPGTYRIFTLGGSTTYGHPWRDSTSFSAWLREMLREAEPGRRYEVINCGGISYASYRVAKLAEELRAYEPDLFIVYNGHNEFLEERTYRGARKSAWISGLSSLLDRTRTYSLLRRALGGAGATGASGTQLAGEVDDVLARTIGPTSYVRDDALRRDVLEHYFVSQKRVADLARSAGAGVVYVTTPANEKDCSPFKSEPTPGLSPEARARVAALRARAASAPAAGAVLLLDSAAALDPRNADVLYAAGQAALRAGRFGEAKDLLTRALDEDVCPLRALPAMRGIEARVARATGSPLVDFAKTLEDSTRARDGNDILGEPDFVDHVHLSVADYGLIAEGLFDRLVADGVVKPDAAWRASGEGLARVRARMFSRLDPMEEGLGYHNIAKVLNWAGKTGDAARAAARGLALDTVSLESIWSSLLFGAQLEREGRSAEALPHYRRALRLDPTNSETQRLLGEALARAGRAGEGREFLENAWRADPANMRLREQLGRLDFSQGRYAEAAGHLRAASAASPADIDLRLTLAGALFASGDVAGAQAEAYAAQQRDPNAAEPWLALGLIAERQGKPGEAIKAYSRALQLRPDYPEARNALARLVAPR
jgi:tetratricopeptide (TPR) repeat protein